MNGNFLLDTTSVIAYFNNNDSIRKQLEEVRVFVPSIVIGELYFGAYKSQKVRENVVQIENFIQISTVISCDVITAKYYGKIKEQLRAKGRPIPEGDIWIAAIALQYNLKLVTQDEHFTAVEGLILEKW